MAINFPSSPTIGLTTTTGSKTWEWTGEGWKLKPSGNIVTRTVSSTTSTEGQTTFSRTYDIGYIDVYLNGTRLDSSEFTATNGTSIVLNVGATENDIIETVSYESVGITSVTVSNDSSPQLGGNLDLNSYNIVGIGSINITGDANVTGGQLATQADAIAYAIALG